MPIRIGCISHRKGNKILPQIQNYPHATESDWRTIATQTQDGVTSSLHVVRTPFGYQRAAELYRPEFPDVPRNFGGAWHVATLPAILYVHWYEPESPTSNRRQFEHEAKELARQGAVCLLVETLWSDIDFFIKRTQADDAFNSIQETVNLRRALDFLLAQPGVDPKRVALVGHDFGGMYGVLTGSVDRRPTHYVIMAATPRLSDWYLYYPKLQGDEREAFIREMAEIDPITHVGKLAPAPILFQFGTNDPHVPNERAREFFEAASEPKQANFYTAGHALDEKATAERKVWLIKQLNLAQPAKD